MKYQVWNIKYQISSIKYQSSKAKRAARIAGKEGWKKKSSLGADGDQIDRWKIRLKILNWKYSKWLAWCRIFGSSGGYNVIHQRVSVGMGMGMGIGVVAPVRALEEDEMKYVRSSPQ